MQTPAPSNSRKRQLSDQYPFELEGGACQTASKKRKAIHTPDPSQPATHQDDPPVVPLERRALRELNRKNTQAARESRAKQQRFRRRPATRLAVAEWNRCHPPLKRANQYLKNCGQEQYRALQSFSKHGGPDLRDLRGCQRAATRLTNPIDSSQTSSAGRSRSRRSTKTKATTEGGTSKSLSPYNRAFQQVLVDARVYPPHYEHPGGRAAPEPENWDDINERLAQPRPSLSPSKFSKEHHKAFIRQDASAAKEDQVKKKVIPLIEGTIEDPRTASGDIPFTNLDPLIADENLASGKPDFFHGARPEQLDRRIRSELEHLIVPSTQHDLPIMPTHFTAAKGPDGSAAVADRQVTYDTFLGSRGFHALQNYRRAEPQYDGKAYTIGTIYHNGLLQLFTSHPVPPANPGEPPSYYLNPLRSFAMRDTDETWRAGATWYRNSMAWTEEERNEAIRAANEVLNQQAPANPQPPIAPNTATSFASTGSQQLGLDSLTMESQVEPVQSPDSEDFQTAASSQDEAEEEEDDDDEEEEEDEEEERRPSLPLPSKRPSKAKSRRQTTSRKKRSREDSESAGSTASPSQEAPPQASAAKKGKERGRGKKPVR